MLCGVTCQAACVSFSVAGGGPQAALPPRCQSAGSKAQGLGPGDSVQPDAFTALPGDCPFPLRLFSVTGDPLHGAEAVPWVHSAREGLHAALPGAQRTGPSWPGSPHLPAPQGSTGVGDAQQSPDGPWAEGRPAAASR